MLPNNNQMRIPHLNNQAKKDLDQLYSALRYKARKGDANPLDKYSQLKNTWREA